MAEPLSRTRFRNLMEATSGNMEHTKLADIPDNSIILYPTNVSGHWNNRIEQKLKELYPITFSAYRSVCVQIHASDIEVNEDGDLVYTSVVGFCPQEGNMGPRVWHVCLFISSGVGERDLSVLNPGLDDMETVQNSFDEAFRAFARMVQDSAGPLAQNPNWTQDGSNLSIYLVPFDEAYGGISWTDQALTMHFALLDWGAKWYPITTED